MRSLENKLGQLNNKKHKLTEEFNSIISELETIEKQKPTLLLEEISRIVAVFEERDSIYRARKLNPPTSSPEDQQLISFYESLGDNKESQIIKARITPFYRKAIARRQQSQGNIEPRITAGTIVIPYETDTERGAYVCITISPEKRNQKGGVIETLVDAATLALDELLDKEETFGIESQGKLLQIKLKNKDAQHVYEALNKIDPVEFHQANIDYRCILDVYQKNQQTPQQQSSPPTVKDSKDLVYGRDAARKYNMDISTIRRAVKNGTLTSAYIPSSFGGRPRFYITKESLDKFLEQRKVDKNAIVS